MKVLYAALADDGDAAIAAVQALCPPTYRVKLTGERLSQEMTKMLRIKTGNAVQITGQLDGTPTRGFRRLNFELPKA